MIKKNAMSNIGYAIVLVIILGVVMIISTPMLANKYNKNPNESVTNEPDINRSDDYETERRNTRNNSYDNGQMVNLMDEMRRIEVSLDSRINDLESRQREFQENVQRNPQNNQSSISDKFICSIEGNLDAAGNFVPIDNNTAMQDAKKQKFVFVCEYRE